MVTDFGAVNKTRPVIRKLDEFLGNYSNQLYRRNYKVLWKTLPFEKTLKYAKIICSDKNFSWKKYRLNTNNCEHYASLLKIGKIYSSQAQHLPQEILYRQTVIPNRGKNLLKMCDVFAMKSEKSYHKINNPDKFYD